MRLVFLLIVFTAIWNGLVIRWKITGKGSKLWHATGLIIRAGMVLVIYIDTGIWPAFIAFIISWIPYNIIISLIVWKKFWYLSDSGIDGLIKRIFK